MAAGWTSDCALLSLCHDHLFAWWRRWGRWLTLLAIISLRWQWWGWQLCVGRGMRIEGQMRKGRREWIYLVFDYFIYTIITNLFSVFYAADLSFGSSSWAKVKKLMCDGSLWMMKEVGGERKEGGGKGWEICLRWQWRQHGRQLIVCCKCCYAAVVAGQMNDCDSSLSACEAAAVGQMIDCACHCLLMADNCTLPSFVWYDWLAFPSSACGVNDCGGVDNWLRFAIVCLWLRLVIICLWDGDGGADKWLHLAIALWKWMAS